MVDTIYAEANKEGTEKNQAELNARGIKSEIVERWSGIDPNARSTRLAGSSCGGSMTADPPPPQIHDPVIRRFPNPAMEFLNEHGIIKDDSLLS